MRGLVVCLLVATAGIAVAMGCGDNLVIEEDDAGADASAEAGVEGPKATRILLVGGQTKSDAGDVNLKSVLAAKVTATGIEAWSDEQSLPGPKTGSAVFSAAGVLHSIGGAQDYTATYTLKPGERAWGLATPLPDPGAGDCVGGLGYGDLLVLCGNRPGNPRPTNVLLTSPPTNFDWKDGRPPLTLVGSGIAVFTSNGVVVVGDPASGASVEVSKREADGSIGWVPANPLGKMMGEKPCGVAAGARAFVIGGINQQAVSFVDVPPSIATTTQLQWKAGPALPEPLARSACVLADNKIFVIGGTDGAGTQKTSVYYAELSDAAGLGEWKDTTPLPVARSAAGAAFVP